MTTTELLALRAKWRASLKPTTAAKYRRALASMGDKTPDQCTQSRGAFRVLRAAYVLGLLDQLNETMKHPPGTRSLLQAPILALLEEWPPGKGVAVDALLDRESKLVDRRRTQGHAGRLSRLPESWQEAMWNATRSDGQRDKLAVLTLTGARPAEVAAGVLVERSGDRIRLTINGAKVTAVSGQQRRTITLDTRTAEARYLAERVTAADGPITIRVTENRLREVIRGVAERVWPQRSAKGLPTPYSYRNRFAEAIKSVARNEVVVAKGMGHASTATQTAYGRQRSKGRSIGLRKVDATREPRVSATHDIGRLQEYRQPKPGYRR